MVERARRSSFELWRELGAWGPRPILSVSTPVVLLSGVSILGTRKPRGIRSCAVDLACRELADIRILRADSASEAVSLELELVRDGGTSYETERARTRRRELVRAGKSSFEPERARSEREELARAWADVQDGGPSWATVPRLLGLLGQLDFVDEIFVGRRSWICFNHGV